MSHDFMVVHQGQHDALEAAASGITLGEPNRDGPFKRKLADGTIHIGYARWNYRTIPPTLEY